jgi:hypothetical protein
MLNWNWLMSMCCCTKRWHIEWQIKCYKREEKLKWYIL